MTTPDYQFTKNWFEQNVKANFDQLIPQINPKRILEIGCFEGASTCYLIDRYAVQHDLEIHCIDTWEGGVEHQDGGMESSDMSAVENRFHNNTNLAIKNADQRVNLVIHKGYSDIELAKLLANGMKGYFDFIYVDGSHQAPDVLCDAVMAFRLCKIGGVIAFDDYLWFEGKDYNMDPIRCPKLAIDTFTNIYCRKGRSLHGKLNQYYFQKKYE